ncbi:MAG: triosephosphate isomerase, triosephosphate isomerase [Candidatus Taylorbacteria bacterium]|nr:triosephosphate isomerase, triosephosphate isomerase [Candidatus Taylorbacteria bacterium]
MNPTKLADAKKIIEGTKKIAKKSLSDIVVCPPFPYINLLSGSKRPFLGAQNMSFEKEGAFTGEVSAAQLYSLGVQYVIVGHSERRAMGETSEVVAKKACAAIQSRISPIICIGEKERNQNAEHWQEIKWQLVDSLQGVNKTNIKKCVIAYEPVWAIGKKSVGPMNPADVAESAIFIKKVLAEMFGPQIAEGVRIVYGGSVDGKSSKDIMRAGGVSGFLVGRASLKPKEFEEIVLACSAK